VCNATSQAQGKERLTMKCHFKILLTSVDTPDVREALKQFEFHIRTKNLTPKTISVYGERLGYFVRYLKSKETSLEQTTRSTIQDYILSMKERGLADISINGQIKVLKIFFKFLKEEELLTIDPSERISLLKCESKLKPILSEQQVQQLFTIPNRKSFHGMRNFCILLVFYDSLPRLNELIHIRKGDVDLERGSIRIFGKGRKERLASLGNKTVKYLHRYLVTFHSKINSEFVFCTAAGQPLDERNVQRILQRIGKRVGIHVSPHLLRHTSATHLTLSGMPAFILQSVLGHTTVQMTQRYVHLAEQESLGSKVRKYNIVDGMKI
jgi:integrase/recombinase XerD